jgi:seryl-tRNA synthetase
MVVKKIVKYPNSENGYDYRIDISETDDLDGKVKILKFQEYYDMTKKMETMEQQLKVSEKEILKKTYEIDKLEKGYTETIDELNRECEENIQNIQFMRETSAKEIMNKNNQINHLKKEIKDQTHYDDVLKELEDTQFKKIKELDQQHVDQLKEYITLNQLQNTALKQIIELSFIDLIRRKHKKIVKRQINVINQKPIKNKYLTHSKN